MKELGYLPTNVKSVYHEARNGILLCPNHHVAFDKYNFYIKWNDIVMCQPVKTHAYTDLHFF